jgi:hypothetical protein
MEQTLGKPFLDDQTHSDHGLWTFIMIQLQADEMDAYDELFQLFNSSIKLIEVIDKTDQGAVPHFVPFRQRALRDS